MGILISKVYFSIQHATKLQAANEKTFKTLAGKCYLFSNVLDKIVKYNLEGMHNYTVLAWLTSYDFSRFGAFRKWTLSRQD